jgi:DNA-binding NarL/FixJ family response regulator
MIKTHEKIIEVLEFVRNEDVKSINHISKELKLNWRTVKSYLNLFDKLGVKY